MGAEEGADGPGNAADRAAKYIRRHNPRSPPVVDRGPVARHLQIPKRRIRAGQPDGGPP